ncbi:Nn.00g021020.m01.CDS01 [Neocucurbitaria sp. VM-36]
MMTTKGVSVLNTYTGTFIASLLSFTSATPILSRSATGQNDLCLTPNCVRAAAHVLNNLHPNYESIDPCENFDQYVCGGFPTRWANTETYTTIEEVGEINKYVLRSILEGPYPSQGNSTGDDETIFNMLVTNYNSCMNNETIEAAGLGEIPEIIAKIAELFPVEDYASGESFSEKDHDALSSAIIYLAELGVPVIGEFWTVADTQVPDTMVPQFGPNLYVVPDHALPVQGGISDLAALEEDQITEILKLILPAGGAVDAAPQLSKSLLDFMAGIKQIEEAANSVPNALELMFHATTVGEAVEQAPNLVLDKVIMGLAPSDYKLDRMELNPARWEFCYTYIDTSLPWIASKFFLDATYSDGQRDVTQTMAEEIKLAFGERLSHRDWIDESTKVLIQEKVEEILVNIGNPKKDPNALNATDLLLYYNHINITESLSSNVLSIRQWAASRAWNQLASPVDRTIWPEFGVHAYDAQARYNVRYNQILLPAGISQAPVLYSDAPSYLAYGAIGFVAGHEITHGFDANGRKWNNDRQHKDWWDDVSVAGFGNRTKCFVDQFSNMEAVDYEGNPVLNVSDNQPLYINGLLTLSENIADAGGIANAFAAWEKHEQSQPSQTLPGLESFTKEQLFFVGAGQMWCSKFTAERMMGHIATNTHAPPFARVLGIAQNSRTFREAFQCKEKEPVCELW